MHACISILEIEISNNLIYVNKMGFFVWCVFINTLEKEIHKISKKFVYSFRKYFLQTVLE